VPLEGPNVTLVARSETDATGTKTAIVTAIVTVTLGGTATMTGNAAMAGIIETVVVTVEITAVTVTVTILAVDAIATGERRRVDTTTMIESGSERGGLMTVTVGAMSPQGGHVHPRGDMQRAKRGVQRRSTGSMTMTLKEVEMYCVPILTHMVITCRPRVSGHIMFSHKVSHSKQYLLLLIFY
jgi:hypothetical protein